MLLVIETLFYNGFLTQNIKCQHFMNVFMAQNVRKRHFNDL